MSKLIEQFLETHRQCTAQNSVFNISQTLDQEALAIIEQAQTEAQTRSKGKEVPHQQKILNTALDARLTRVLDKVDLLNKAHYDTLRNAIHRWCPWQKGKQQACLQVQKVLLTLLPVARQKQELGALCQEYKAHLKNWIEEEVKKIMIIHTLPAQSPGQLCSEPHPWQIVLKSVWSKIEDHRLND